MIITKSKMSVQPGTGDMIKFWSVNFGVHRLGGAFFNHRGRRKRRAYTKMKEKNAELPHLRGCRQGQLFAIYYFYLVLTASVGV